MSNKHDANVRKSTLVNFQIGLIASLLFSYLMFEVYTAVPVVNQPPPITIDDGETHVWDGRFTEFQEPEEKMIAEKQSKPVVDPQEFEIVKNDATLTAIDEEFKSEPTESAPIDPSTIVDVEPVEEPESYPFTRIEWVPIFPGCEKLATNKERAICFSEKVGRIVSKKFNTGLGEKYGLTGLQRIYTQFDVDQNGIITNIQVRAPHPKLEKEAKRVIGLFPQMTPGKQRDQNVTVKYQLPIVFKIQD